MLFLDLFAGVGGFRMGMEAAGHQCVGYVEIDKHARKSYQAIYNTEGEWTAHDITKVSDDDIRLLGRERGPIHIICGGFPCQAFSVAGKRGGFSDTRGTLFFEIARFASILKPKYLFLENVKGLLSHDRGNTFETILRTLDELGYDAEWQVLNSKDFGVPQHRERVFIIGHSRRERTRQVFPITGKGSKATLQQLNGPIADAYRIYHSKGLARTLKGEAGGLGAKTGLYLVPKEQNTPILVTRHYDRLNPRKIVTCLDANYSKGLDNHQARTGVLDNGRVRKLTPRECWRLQGFPDWAFDKAQQAGLSDTQLYKQAGNSVSVPVILEIAKKF